MVITDSGSIQEEAPSLGKTVPERPGAVIAGCVNLVGTDKTRILTEASALLEDKAAYQKLSLAHNPYGDGKAAERIVGILTKAPLP